MLAQGIAAFGPGDVWAAALDGQSGDTLFHHWDGESWRQVALPNPSGELRSIFGTSSEDLWLLTLNEARHYEARHWDGHRWTSFDLGDHIRVSETAVRNRNDAWIVGSRYERPKEKPYAWHWNGDTWRKMTTPKELDDVAIVSTNDVWASNHESGWTADHRYRFMHWDGRRWRRMLTPPIEPPPGGEIDQVGGEIYRVEIHDLTTGPSGDVWAAGLANWSKPGDESLEEEFQRGKPLLMHWDGRRWSYTLVTKAYEGYTEGYRSVAPDGAGGVWAVKDSVTYVHHDRHGGVTTVKVPGSRTHHRRFVVSQLVNLPGSTSMLAIGFLDKPHGDVVVQGYGPLS